MKTEFENGALVFSPAELFSQEAGSERGRQFEYRQRRKWCVYEISETDSVRKYIGSILTAPRATKAQILEAWDAKN